MPSLLEKYNENLSTIYSTTGLGTETYETPRTSVNPTNPFITVLPNTNDTSTGVNKRFNGAFLSTSRIKDDIRLAPYGASVARDGARIFQFLQSPKGVRFLATQTTLQAFNAYPKTRIFNLGAGILASLVPGVHAKRFVDTTTITNTVRGIFTGQVSSQVGLSPIKSGLYGDNGWFTGGTNNGMFTGKNAFSRALRWAAKDLKNLNPFAKPEQQSNINDPYNKTPQLDAPRAVTVVNTPTAGTAIASTLLDRVSYKFLQETETPESTNKTDIISFRFKTVGTTQEETEYIPFRAFISTITESVKPEHNEQRYIGRTERFITYSGAKRTASIEFNIVAFSEKEIDAMWTRINYLTGLAFPKGVSASGFMIPQLFKITIGKIYQDQPCYIESLDYTMLDEMTTFDIDREVAQVIKVQMNISLIEKTSRYYNSPFYQITEDNTEAGIAKRIIVPNLPRPLPELPRTPTRDAPDINTDLSDTGFRVPTFRYNPRVGAPVRRTPQLL